MCRVSSFCCCLSLRAGAIVTSCLLLLQGAAALVLLSWYAHMFTLAIENAKESDTPTQEQKEAVLLMLQVMLATVIIALAVFAVAVMINIVLLAGAINLRRALVFTWLIGYGVVYSLVIILGLLVSGVFFMRGDNEAGIYVSAFVAADTAVTAYLWLVVYSLHRDLRGEYGTPGKVYRTVPAEEGPAGKYSEGLPMMPPPQYTA